MGAGRKKIKEEAAKGMGFMRTYIHKGGARYMAHRQNIGLVYDIIDHMCRYVSLSAVTGHDSRTSKVVLCEYVRSSRSNSHPSVRRSVQTEYQDTASVCNSNADRSVVHVILHYNSAAV